MTEIEQPTFSFDAASAISCGARDYQEDALVSDFANGDDLGFVVLADGMGGHAAGDVASKIIVTEMFRALTFQREAIAADGGQICGALRDAAETANKSLDRHVQAHPDTKGMGATLVSAVVSNRQLYWVSVGDSPLFLFRDGVLNQLNEDHSMAGQIDLMVEKGMISAEEGQSHPDRNVLTSVLFGAPITQMDCPEKPMQLQAGDTVIVASDGLQFLDNDQISRTLRDLPLSRSKEIAEALMSQLFKLQDPDLDNISLSVIQVSHARQDICAITPPNPVAKDPSLTGLLGVSSGLASKGRSLFSGKSQR